MPRVPCRTFIPVTAVVSAGAVALAALVSLTGWRSGDAQLARTSAATVSTEICICRWISVIIVAIIAVIVSRFSPPILRELTLLRSLPGIRKILFVMTPL